MLHEVMTQVSMEEFRSRTQGKKLVLLYPWTAYRSLFIAHFYRSNEEGLLYYAVANGQATLAEWLTSMVAEFRTQFASFGAALSPLLKKKRPAALGEALAQDLSTLGKGRWVLFVDEFDRLPLNGDLMKFIPALIAALPKNVQVCFSSRRLAYQPWYDAIASGDAVLLGAEHRRDDGMFTVTPDARPRLEVYAFGRGYVFVNGYIVENWDGSLPRNLFFYFMDKERVTRAEIFQDFWPNLGTKEATNVFHVTKRKVSECLSGPIDPSKSYELTQYMAGFYLPGEKLMRHYDVANFQADIEQSALATDEAEEERLLLRAVDAYRAPFLQEGEQRWMAERREELRQMNAQAQINLGRIARRRDDLDRALGFFHSALKEYPEREDVYRDVMNLYLRLGRKADAVILYKALADALKRAYNILPSEETQALYRMIENMPS